MELFDEFLKISQKLNELNIVPTLMGSLGLEYLTKLNWQPSDIDIHVAGDPRGWQAPDELRIYQWPDILKAMTELGFELIDLHEHEFKKGQVRVEFGTIDSLHAFAGIREEDIGKMNVAGIQFRLPDLDQFLKIYLASSQDSYRNENNNNKDFAKIRWLEQAIQARNEKVLKR